MAAPQSNEPFIFQEEIPAVITALSSGKTILYPTDTIWGIGCDATNEQAVNEIFRVKMRNESQSMLVLIDEAENLTRFVAEVPELAWQLIEITEKPLTIIYPQGIHLAPNLMAKDGSIAIRVVRDEFCKNMIRKFGKPVVSTSANMSGSPWPQNFSQIDPAIVRAVGYVVNWRQNDNTPAKPSGMIRLGLNGEVKVIRE